MKILNFGSLNIDHVYRVAHISAPGETVASLSLMDSPGGKGLNQSVALAKAGAEVYHAGCVGADGEWLVDLLESAGVNTKYLRAVSMPNGHAVIQVDHAGQNSIIIHGGSNQAISQEQVVQTLGYFGEEDIVLLQNEISQVTYIAEQCAKKQIPLAFNPSPFSPELLEQFPFEAVTYLLINETEGQQISGEQEPDKIVQWLLSRYPKMQVVLTLGGKGVLYANSQTRIRQPAFRVEAVDTTGAGDTFAGFFLGMAAKGSAIDQALRYACAAAAMAVTKPGAAQAVPSLQKVEQFLMHAMQ